TGPRPARVESVGRKYLRPKIPKAQGFAITLLSEHRLSVFSGEITMAKVNLSGMTVEALMDLRKRVDETLVKRRAEIEKRLERMDGAIAVGGTRVVGGGKSALNAHAAPRLRLCPSQCRPRYTGATGLARPQEHPAHGALHRVGSASVQGLLALTLPAMRSWSMTREGVRSDGTRRRLAIKGLRRMDVR